MPNSSPSPAETVQQQQPHESDVVSGGFPSLNPKTLNHSDPENTPPPPQPAVKSKSVMSNLNPIPFIPQKNFNFSKHEKLLRMLGLWEFVHVDFDRDIRVDLIAQLIATYDSKSRASYVDGFRVTVNRDDLARAFKLPVQEKGGNAGGIGIGIGIEVGLEWEALSDESIVFITEFASEWVLLHEDIWIMPTEVAAWVQLMRDGHPEKVDWAGLFWFMVEKEVKQGGRLTNCYYASHLQRLMKFQHKEMFLNVRTNGVGDVYKGDEIIGLGEEGTCLMEGGPSTELTIVKDGRKEGGWILIKDVEEDEEEEEEVQEQGQRLLLGKCKLGEHFMHPCNAESPEEFKSFELIEEDKEETEEEEDGDQFHDFSRNDGYDEGFSGNLLGAMYSDQLGFNTQDPFCNRSSIPSFFINSGKRVIEHDHSNERSKKLRINNNEFWNHNNNDKAQLDFGTWMTQIQHMTERARMLYEEKEEMLEYLNTNQQLLLNKLDERDRVIEHLQTTRLEEIQKKDSEIYRLERELDLMADALEGYRKALKETRMLLSEYREKARVSEEPKY